MDDKSLYPAFKILLVEDEAVTHRAICKSFETNNYNYVGVKNLTDAVNKVKTEHFVYLVFYLDTDFLTSQEE